MTPEERARTMTETERNVETGDATVRDPSAEEGAGRTTGVPDLKCAHRLVWDYFTQQTICLMAKCYFRLDKVPWPPEYVARSCGARSLWRYDARTEPQFVQLFGLPEPSPMEAPLGGWP